MIAPYLVHAFNTAKASENKIHDDTVAARFGFTGGLVPGVDVYAYMTHQAVAKWGRAWLEHGTAECRFGKPVYDGEIAEVEATVIEGGIGLSVTSKHTLVLQGGIYDAELAEDFITRPHAPDAVNLRRWDDLAKSKSCVTPPIAHFLDIARSVAIAPGTAIA